MRVKFDSGLKQKKCVWYAHILLLLISIVFQGIKAVTLGTNSNPPVRSTVQYSFPTGVYNAIEGFSWADGGFSFADSLTICTFNSFFPFNGPVALALEGQCLLVGNVTTAANGIWVGDGMSSSNNMKILAESDMYTRTEYVVYANV